MPIFYKRRTTYRRRYGSRFPRKRLYKRMYKRSTQNTLKTSSRGLSLYNKPTFNSISQANTGYPNDLRCALRYSGRMLFSPVAGTDLASFIRLNNPTQTDAVVIPSIPNSWTELGGVYSKCSVLSTKVEWKAVISKTDPAAPGTGTMCMCVRPRTSSATTGSFSGESERPDAVVSYLTTDSSNENPVQKGYYQNWKIIGEQSPKSYEDEESNQVSVINTLYAMPSGNEAELGFFVRNTTFPLIELNWTMYYTITFHCRFTNNATIPSRSHPDDPSAVGPTPADVPVW